VRLFGRRKRTPDQDEAAVTAEVDAEGTDDAGAPERGPKDVADADDSVSRLDLGSLRVRGVPGMELRLEVDEDRQRVIGAHLVLGESQMQVQAFAAPKSAGIWDEIRDEIAQGIATGGGTAENIDGPLGTELHARMPTSSGGRTVFTPARFVGWDGPRWFLRAVMSGHAAIDDAVAEQFYDLLDDIVVVRGEVPMAPREVLALELPKTATASDDDTQAAEDSELNPFERGPEITEIR